MTVYAFYESGGGRIRSYAVCLGRYKASMEVLKGHKRRLPKERVVPAEGEYNPVGGGEVKKLSWT